MFGSQYACVLSFFQINLISCVEEKIITRVFSLIKPPGEAQ